MEKSLLVRHRVSRSILNKIRSRQNEILKGVTEGTINPKCILDRLENALYSAIEYLEVTAELTVAVDYSLSLQEMIRRGNYDKCWSGFSRKHFPLRASLKGRKIRRRLFLVNEGCSDTSTQFILQKMKGVGLQPATLEDLLAVGISRPSFRWKYRIVSLGSVWRNQVALCEDNGLSLKDHRQPQNDGVWDSSFCFLAVQFDSQVS